MAESPRAPRRWRKVRTEPHASTRIFEVTRAFFRHPDRSQDQDFFVIDPPDWVNVVALTPEHHLVLVRQFRFGTGEFSIEVPGGVIDPGEAPLAAACRELREETGFVGGAARLLGSVHPNPAMQSNRCHLVLIENARQEADIAWDPDEEFEILTRPVEAVYGMIAQGEITHALVLDALLLFRPHWEKLRLGRANA